MSNKDLPLWMQHHTGVVDKLTPEMIDAELKEHHNPEETFDAWYDRVGHKQHAALMGYYGSMAGKQPETGGRLAALGRFIARIDWQRVFRVAVVAVNVGAVIYALSKIVLAFSIGGVAYAVVTAGTTAAYMLFFAAFAVVMVKRHDMPALLATAMTLLSAFVI